MLAGVDTGAKLEKRGNAGGRKNARGMYARLRLELGSEPNLEWRGRRGQQKHLDYYVVLNAVVPCT